MAHQLGQRPGRRPGGGPAAVQSVLHAQAVPAAIEVEWAEHGRGAVQRAARGARGRRRGRAADRPGAARRARRPSRRTHRRAVRRTPGTLTATGDQRSHRAQADLRALRARRRARRSRGDRRFACGARPAPEWRTPRIDRRHPARRTVRGASTGSGEVCTAHRRHCRRRGRTRRGQGRRRRLGTDPGPRPDAPRQGPVRPRPPARAGPLRGRHLDDDTSEHDTERHLG